jgi:hypothetical protein
MVRSSKGSVVSESNPEQFGIQARRSSMGVHSGLWMPSDQSKPQEEAMLNCSTDNNPEIKPTEDSDLASNAEIVQEAPLKTRPYRQNPAYWTEAISLFASFKHNSFRSRRRSSYVFLSDELKSKGDSVEKSGSYRYFRSLLLPPKSIAGQGSPVVRDEFRSEDAALVTSPVMSSQALSGKHLDADKAEKAGVKDKPSCQCMKKIPDRSRAGECAEQKTKTFFPYRFHAHRIHRDRALDWYFCISLLVTLPPTKRSTTV